MNLLKKIILVVFFWMISGEEGFSQTKSLDAKFIASNYYKGVVKILLYDSIVAKQDSNLAYIGRGSGFKHYPNKLCRLSSAHCAGLFWERRKRIQTLLCKNSFRKRGIFRWSHASDSFRPERKSCRKCFSVRSHREFRFYFPGRGFMRVRLSGKLFRRYEYDAERNEHDHVRQT